MKKHEPFYIGIHGYTLAHAARDWAAGLDTYDIAQKARVREGLVYRYLDDIRTYAREWCRLSAPVPSTPPTGSRATSGSRAAPTGCAAAGAPRGGSFLTTRITRS